jgi:hypothetical protein
MTRTQGIKAGRGTLASVVIGTSLLASGCSVALRHGPLDAPARQYSDSIAMSQRSEGIDGKVGWGRGTVFYIPIVPVYIDGDGNEKVMEQVRDALQQVGYKVSFVGVGTAAPGPVLKCQVRQFWFNNYTWLFPLVPTWGSIKLTATLVSPSGAVLWAGSFSGSGFTLNFADGYSTAANEAMTTILNDMVAAFSSDEFHRALTQV